MAKKGKGKKRDKALVSTESKALTALERQMADLERRFDEMIRNWGLAPAWEFPEAPAAPRVDILDKGRKLVVRAEVPGMKKEDLEVKVTDRAITLRGRTRKEKKTKEKDYVQREIVSSSFVRTLSLPAAVDAKRAKAKLKNGVLHLVLPKVDGEGEKAVKVK